MIPRTFRSIRFSLATLLSRKKRLKNRKKLLNKMKTYYLQLTKLKKWMNRNKEFLTNKVSLSRVHTSSSHFKLSDDRQVSNLKFSSQIVRHQAMVVLQHRLRILPLSRRGETQRNWQKQARRGHQKRSMKTKSIFFRNTN